jgi:hypothetical protein
VWRVTYFHIKPGQSEAFWKDIRENMKLVYADFKKEGLITDYKMWLNDTTDHPGDWDVAVGILFPNYAALDAGKRRNEIREVVASKLAREVMPK